MKKITAIVPIRKGSKRVVNKNLRDFADTTLLELKIDNLIGANVFDDIIVNTDSEHAITIAKNKGVKYHRRDAYFASSECSGSDFFKHLGEVTQGDIIAYCPVTSPFIKQDTIINCVKTFCSSKNYDSLTTVSSIKEFLWQNKKALNYDVNNAPNSQDLPDIFALNFGISLIERGSLITQRNIIGTRPQFIETCDIESIDIDTPLDFYIAEKIYQRLFIEGKTLLD